MRIGRDVRLMAAREHRDEGSPYPTRARGASGPLKRIGRECSARTFGEGRNAPRAQRLWKRLALLIERDYRSRGVVDAVRPFAARAGVEIRTRLVPGRFGKNLDDEVVAGLAQRKCSLEAARMRERQWKRGRERTMLLGAGTNGVVSLLPNFRESPAVLDRDLVASIKSTSKTRA